jgi:Domain of unknown function (DUF4136)
MSNTESKVTALLVAVGITFAMHVLHAVDVRVEFDKAFDFKSVRTWTWHPGGPGDVKMARTQQDDPEAMRQRAEPVIVDAVTSELARIGLRPAGEETPDLSVKYYLLLTVGSSAQALGQFLPATTMWGVPPFAPATQSLEVMNRGSLVLDLAAGDKVIWRGLADARIRMGSDDKKGEGLIRTAVRDLLRKVPRS